MRKTFYFLTISVLLITVLTTCNKDVAVAGVKLDENPLTLVIGETKTLIVTVLPKDATNKLVTWVSSDPKVATVTSSGEVISHSIGKTIIEVTTVDGNHTAKCEITVIKEWIEINGVKWATRNVNTPGTFTTHPYDAGMFYQWNSKIGWSSTDPMVNSDGGTTWNEYFSVADTWESVNDPCPDGWRVPTQSEFESLLYSRYVWKNYCGINGCYFGKDSASLFFPAAGSRGYGDGFLHWVNSNGFYWSSSSWENSPDAYSVILYEHTIGEINYGKALGFSVRCVAEH